MIRVVVAEDQWAVRSGLVMILEGAGDIAVVAEAADGEEAVEQARRTRPDVVLMDVRMPRMDGIAAARALAGTADVLVLTTFDTDAYVFGALKAGAAGFLLKDIEAGALVEAVRTVARGDGLIAPGVTRRLIAAFTEDAGGGAGADEGPQAGAAELASLTDRERDVLACVGEGLSNRQIARRLTISEATVKTHVSRLLAKLGLASRVQAAIVARSHPRG